MDAKKSGLITFDEVPLVFVERGADTDTDDLRVMHGMQERRSAAVPEDSRPERHTLANLFAKHLFDLAKKRATYVSISLSFLHILCSSARFLALFYNN